MTEDGIQIAQQYILAGARFVLIRGKQKVAFEENWHTENNYDASSPRLQAHVKAGGNYGVLSKNGICCIDIDNPEEFKKLNLPPLKTFMVKRGEHGHIYFKCPDCPEDKRKKFEERDLKTPFGDVRLGGNFYTVGANCIHPSGDTYEVLRAEPISDIPWSTIQNLLSGDNGNGTTTAEFKLPPVTKQRHYSLKHMVCSGVGKNYSYEAILASCQAENLKSFSPPKPADVIEKEVRAIFDWAKKEQIKKEQAKAEYGPTAVLNKEISELLRHHHHNTAIAKFLNKRIGREAGDKDIVRFCTTDNLWYVWTGEQWLKDEKNMVLGLAWDNIVKLQTDAVNLREVELQKNIMKAESDGEILSALTLMKTLVSVTTESFDCDNNLLNVKNGTIDLMTGKLGKHDKNNLITKMAPVEYKQTATCPKWGGHLKLIFADDDTLINAFQRAMGYSLLGGNAENKMFIAVGGGQNGKSITFKALHDVLGDYAIQSDPSTFYIKNHNEGPRPDIARMKGARIITSSEGTSGKQFDEALIKQLTGGDPVTARFLYGREFSFVPTGTIWYYTNSLPRIRDRDLGIWRRPYPIPFDVRISDDKKIPDYDKILVAEEASGILNWLLKGLADYLKVGKEGGLLYPDKVTKALEHYKVSTDILSEFMEYFRITGTEKDRLKRSFLYESYKTFCNLHDDKPLSKTVFNSTMEQRLGPAKKTEDGFFWYGIRQVKNISTGQEIAQTS